MKLRHFIISLILFTLTACESLPSLNDSIKVAATWQQMNDDFDNGLKAYHQHLSIFTDAEQKTMQNGFVAMNSARITLRKLRQENATGKPLALAEFFTAYGDAKTGYLSIRPILLDKQKNLSSEARVILLSFDQEARQLDQWVNEIANKKATNGINLNEIMSFISGLANIVGALKAV